MTAQTNFGANPLAYAGVNAPNPPTVVSALRAPTTSDINYPIGTLWVDVPNNDSYQMTSVVANSANWTLLGNSSSAVLDVAHGGTGDSTLTNHGVLVGAGTSPITQLSVGATNSVLAGSTGADPAFTTTPTVVSLTTTTTVAAGTTVTGGTGVTATTGNITATNGNIVRGTAGNKDVYSSVASTTTAGANSAGTVTLAGGTATVSTTAVTASSQIRLYRQGIGATGAAALGILTLGTVTAGVSFVINAVQAANATALQASDVSVIGWEIVN